MQENDLILKDLVFEERFGDTIGAFIVVTNPKKVQIEGLKIHVKSYNTLVQIINEINNPDLLVTVEKVEFQLDQAVQVPEDQREALFNFQQKYREKGYLNIGSVEISGVYLTVLNEKDGFYVDTLFSISGFFDVYFSNFIFEKMKTNMFAKDSIFEFVNIHELIMNDLNFMNNSLIITSFHAFFSFDNVSFLEISNLNYISNHIALYWALKNDFLAKFRRIDQIIFKNHTIANNTFEKHDVSFFSFVPIRETSSQLQLHFNITNVTFSNNTYNTPDIPAISYLSCHGPVLKYLDIKNFTVSDNSISGKLLDFITYSVGEIKSSDLLHIPLPSPRTLKGINIVNNTNASVPSDFA
ncbi:MAG: hypothetical protein EOO43_23745, partial [Flavobacterium sp.]